MRFLFFIFAFVFLTLPSVVFGACTEHNISYGDIVSGTLDIGDCEDDPYGPGYYDEKILFSGTSGDQLQIDVSYADEDGYIILVDDGDSSIVYEEIVLASGSDIFGPITLPTTGSYTLWVSTWDEYVVTDYSVTLSVVYEGPSATSFSPEDNSFNVAKDVQPSITFGEIVQKGSGNITLKKVSDNSTVETINVDSSQITGWGTETLTISFSHFDWGTEYAIQIDATAVKNETDLFYAGISDNEVWSFTVRPEGDEFSFSDTFENQDFIDLGVTDALWSSLSDDFTPGNFLPYWSAMDGTAGKENLSDDSGVSRRPQIVLDSSDYPVVVWDDDTIGNHEIYVSRWNGSDWTQMDGVTSGYNNVSNTPGDSFSPQIVLDAFDNPIVVWHDYDGDIYVSRWSGSAWVKMDGAAGYDNVSNTVGGSYDAQILLNSSDYPIVVWDDDTTGNHEIYVSRWNGAQWSNMGGLLGMIMCQIVRVFLFTRVLS